MILIFDPNPPFLRCCKVENAGFSEYKCKHEPEWYTRLLENIGDVKQVEAIGYLLYHGGEEIRDPVSRLTAESFSKIQSAIRFLPERNDMTFKTARFWTEKLPDVPHILFCDTAFFANLPAEASTYAIPYKLREKGIRRYGGFGLCHQWAWEKTQALFNGAIQKVVSIYLGNLTNIAATKNGQPVETTIGFTFVEGIPSPNSCGDIDPTVIFHLYSKGMTFEEINELLSTKSGFCGLLGRRCGFLDILRNTDDSQMSAVREVFRYDIMKYLGAFISALGGVDAVVFLSEQLREAMSLILEICHGIEFLGLELMPSPEQSGDLTTITHGDSPVKALGLKYNKWAIMAQKAKTFPKSGGN